MAFQIAGTRNGLKWPVAGTAIDLPEGEALDLISTGAAELADEDDEPAPVLEVRPAPAPETRAPALPAPPPRPEPMPNPVDKGGRLFGRRIKD